MFTVFKARGYNRTLNMENKVGFEASIDGIIVQCHTIYFLFTK